MEKYKADVPFKAWIRKIMVNVLIDEFRKKEREKENVIIAHEYAEHTPLVEINNAIAKDGC